MASIEVLREKYVQTHAGRTEQSRKDVRNAWTAGAVTMMTDGPPPKRQKFRGVSAFVRRLALEGGSIVSTAALTPEQIAQARADGKLFVLADGLGFALVPYGVLAPSDAAQRGGNSDG
jgi:hypothetical protein